MEERNHYNMGNNIEDDNINNGTSNIDIDNTHEESISKGNSKDNTLKDIADMVLYLGTVILAVLLIYNFVGQQVQVTGSSMEATLSDEDRLILEKISYRFGTPERFDVVVFRPYEEDKDLYYIKRIIGLPGETVQIIGSKIYINDEVLVEDYGNEPIEDPGAAEEAHTLGSDEYFVLGDNRNHSTDSRYEIGNVTRDAIIGRTLARIWPLTKMEILKHQ